MNQQDVTLHDAFHAAVFHGPRPDGGWPSSFAIVTACNPDGRNVDAASNRKATRELEARIGERGFRYGPMTGGSIDGTHQEFGYLVECDLTSALNLGADYKQVAIFWIEDGNLFLVTGSDASNKRFVDTWEDRYKGTNP